MSPARNSSLCEAISASAGVSFRVGMRVFDQRIQGAKCAGERMPCRLFSWANVLDPGQIERRAQIVHDHRPPETLTKGTLRLRGTSDENWPNACLSRVSGSCRLNAAFLI